jgi:thiol-disulfide isomerase/thioredoxin
MPMKPEYPRRKICFTVIAGLLAVLMPALAAAVMPGEVPPAVDGAGMAGTPPVKWPALKGRIIVVDFWALWCAPCRAALPRLERLRVEHQDDPVSIISINLDEDEAEVRDYLKAHPVGFPVLHDPGAKTAMGFGVKRLPMTYLIDKKGVVRWIIEGTDGRDDKDLRESLASMLKDS